MASPPPSAPGPLPKHTPLLVEGLRSLGCQVSTAAWGSGEGERSLGERVAGRVKDLLRIWWMAARSSTDVVVVKTAHDWATLARDIPLMMGLRVVASARVIQFHGSQPESLLQGGRPLFRVATRLLLATVSAVLVLSREEKRLWGAFRPATPIYVVKNPHRPRPALPEPCGLGEEVGIGAGASSLPGRTDENDAPVVLFVGRLIAPKGVLDLVEAAGMLAASTPDLPLRVVMAGDGPEAASIMSRARALGIADRVTLTGHVDTRALGRLYGRAWFLALPTSHPEGFPTVIAEAMAAGLPIVTTPIRGAVDYLEDGVNALFIPAGEPAALARAMRRLLKDAELRRSMGERNRARVALFSPDRVAREYLEALRQAVEVATA